MSWDGPSSRRATEPQRAAKPTSARQRRMQPPTGGGLSWWLLPLLRGGHRGGLRRFAAVMAEVFACPFVAVTAEVILHQQQKCENSVHVRLPLFYRRDLLRVCAPSRYLRRQALFLDEVETKITQNKHTQKNTAATGRRRRSRRSTPPRHGGHCGLLRARPVVMKLTCEGRRPYGG